MKKVYKGAFVILGYALFFSSCQSLNQDKMISTVFQEQLNQIQQIENEFSKVESDFLINSTPSSLIFENLKDINIQIDELLQEPGLELQARAKLLSLKGKCSLLSDKKSAAKVYYEKALSCYKGEVQTVILGNRLGILKGDIENQKISSDDKALLVLENAINSYKEKNYAVSVSKFDEAFLNLDGSYKLIYENVRNSAWKLKNVSNSRDASHQTKDVITVGQMMEITANETNLLYNYTGAKKLSEYEIYRRLSKASLTRPLRNSSQNELLKDENVTRIKCARFLWNLITLPYEEKVKYSALIKNADESPVKDVNPSDPDFDAVLGTIENELMDLPDGENFFPDLNVSGIEFLTAVKKIKR